MTVVDLRKDMMAKTPLAEQSLFIEETKPSASDLFDLAPVPLWFEDWSGVRELLEEWRGAGVTSIRPHLEADRERVAAASKRIRLIAVNPATLALFEAKSFEDLEANIDRVFSGDMLTTHIEELEQLWNGDLTFQSMAVNYSLSGRRVDIQLKGRILPGFEGDWSRVLIVTEDVSERETAQRQLLKSERFARGLFEHSPVSLWVEDFSVVKNLLDDVRARGVSDFRTFIDVHPEFVGRCLSEIRVIDVNRYTLDLFKAPDKETLVDCLGDVFREEVEQTFREQLVDLWEGKLLQQREVMNYSLEGEELHLHLQFSVLPGYEHDWSLVQIALTDITARKKAEAYLEFLGKHDALTKLYNRSFFMDELNRLERKGPHPVTIVIADLNGLKAVNDSLGHGVGDALLRRAGEVLNEAVKKPNSVARIGGDEFAIVLPGSGQAEGAHMRTTIEELVEVNNQFYTGPALSFSVGFATAASGERLEDVVQRADAQMYDVKRAFYASPERDRRNASNSLRAADF